MFLGENGYVFGWSEKFQIRWATIKNDPNLLAQRSWKRLDPHWKFALTGSPEYLPGDIVLDLTKGEYWQYCGTRPWEAVSTSGSIKWNMVLRRYKGTDPAGDFKNIIEYTKVDSKIKVSPVKDTPLPSELNIDDTYFVVSQTPEVILNSTTSGGFYYLNDNTVDFSGAKVNPNTDLIEKVSTGRLFTISYVTEHQLGVELGERHFNAGDQYKIIRYSFGLSKTKGGIPIALLSSAKFNFQPHDQIFYYPDNCYTLPRYDDLKEQFYNSTLKYMIYREKMTPTQIMQVNDVFYTLCDLFLNVNPVGGIGDYDNYHSSFISLTTFALALKDQNDPRYLKIVEHPRYVAQLNGIKKDFDDFYGGIPPDNIAGPFMQGTNYDPTTTIDFIARMDAIERYTGQVYFPRLKTLYPKIAEALKAYFAGFGDTFQWSDNGNQHTNYDRLTYENIAIMSDLADDKELRYMWDKINEGNSVKFDNKNCRHSPFQDPYGGRATEEEWNTKMSGAVFNDSIQGIAFMHTGWKSEDSHYAVIDWAGNPFVDHNFYQDIALCRKGIWLMDWLRGYAGTHWHVLTNCFTPFSAFAILTVRVQRDLQYGKNWMYFKGVRKNDSRWVSGGDKRYTEFTGAGNVLEQIREVFVYRATNGADHVFVFDTLETPSGDNGTATRKDGQGRAYENVPNNFKGVELSQDNAIVIAQGANYRHNFKWHLPTFTPEFDPTTNSWNFKGCNPYGAQNDPDGRPGRPGNEMARLTTFVKNYSSTLTGITAGQAVSGSNGTNSGYASGGFYGAFLDIKTSVDERFGRHTWAHALYGYSPNDILPTYTRTTTGLIAVIGDETIEVSVSPKFTLKLNGKIQIPLSSPANPVPEPEPEPTPIPNPNPTPTPTPEPNPMPETWKHLANEDEVVTMTKTAEVRFGAGGKYFSEIMVAGRVFKCSVPTFGDPIPNVKKTCEIKVSEPVPTPTPTPTPVPTPPSTDKAVIEVKAGDSIRITIERI